MIDFHSHILPYMDDGAENVEMSAKMLELSKSQGINTIVATPHFYIKKGTVSDFLQKREDSYNKLKAYIEENKLDVPEIILGAEVAFSEEILSVDINKLCIEGTNLVLLELPFTYFNKWIYDEIYSMSMKSGVDFILAHIERYVGNKNDFSSVKPFFDLDMLIQVNADTFIDKHSKKIIQTLFKKYRIDLIGSDAHNLEKRVSNMDKAMAIIKKKYGENVLQKIMNNGKKILNK